MLLGTTTSANSLLGSLGGISANTYSVIFSWVIIAVGIPLGFVVARWLIDLLIEQKRGHREMIEKAEKVRGESEKNAVRAVLIAVF